MRDRGRASGAFAIRVLLGALLALSLPLTAALPLDRPPTVQLIDRDPSEGAVLRAGEPLYLRLRYRSAVPLHVLVSGYLGGKLVGGFAQDGDELFPAGDREATVWLAYPRKAEIDHVQIRLWNANKARVALADFPIEAAWTGASDPGGASRRTTRSWVAELTPGQRARIAEALSAADETGGFDPFDLIFLCVPGYFLLQLALTLWTSGGWRRATLAPALIMVPILAYTVLAFAAQSNLWPLLMLLSAPLAFLYLVLLSVVLLLRRLARAA